MAEINRDEFEGWMGILRDDIRGVHDRLDELNGRTRKSEVAIGVLKDRSDRLERQQRDQKREQMKAGGFMASIAAFGSIVILKVGELLWAKFTGAHP